MLSCSLSKQFMNAPPPLPCSPSTTLLCMCCTAWRRRCFLVHVTGKNLLDGRYTEFGYTIANAELLADVKEGDIIKSAKVLSGKENWKQSA